MVAIERLFPNTEPIRFYLQTLSFRTRRHVSAPHLCPSSIRAQVGTAATTCSEMATTTFGTAKTTESVIALTFLEEKPLKSDWYIEQNCLRADIITNASSTSNVGVLSSLATQIA
jgi:hypothetical protein